MKIIRVDEKTKNGNDCVITVRRCLIETNRDYEFGNAFQIVSTHEYNGSWVVNSYDTERIQLDCKTLKEAIKEFEKGDDE